MNITRFCSFAILPFSAVLAFAGAIDVDLGTAGSFSVLAGSTVTNTGSTILYGDLGVWPGTAITGFPPGVIVGGSEHSSDAVAMAAQRDLTTAYNFAAGEACGTTLTGQNLGGLTLTPGVYCFSSSAQLTGTLTLDSEGDPNAVFVFQIGTTLTTASDSSVLFNDGGQGQDLFWQVGSSATLGTSTDFAGNILAETSITMNTDATIDCGSALAMNGAVTLDTNTVSTNSASCQATVGSVPEPGTTYLAGAGLLLTVGLYQRYRKSRAARI